VLLVLVYPSLLFFDTNRELQCIVVLVLIKFITYMYLSFINNVIPMLIML